MPNHFDTISPIDNRYWDAEIAEYLSEAAFLQYKLKVEIALVQTLAAHGMCSAAVVDEVIAAAKIVTVEEVYKEEEKTRHDIRALVNCLRNKVSESARPYVHMTATSYDIIDSANALRYKEAITKLLAPRIETLIRTLIALTNNHADIAQVGRTHGQHAVPITVGYMFAGYLERIGASWQAITQSAQELRGKFAGAVGAYNASSLIMTDPAQFECDVLAKLDIIPAAHSTQVVPGEAMARLLANIAILAGVLADCADDMRHLQRTEIAEVHEAFGATQVGSSTMPQKRNPIGFENVKSLWKVIIPRVQTVFMDQLSEHQRDLTNSASSRSAVEIVAYAAVMLKRLNAALSTIEIDNVRVKENLKHEGDFILAEPLYILLASVGCPDAHEKVRTLALACRAAETSLAAAIATDTELAPYMAKLSDTQKTVLKDTYAYVGIAPRKARTIAARWEKFLNDKTK